MKHQCRTNREQERHTNTEDCMLEKHQEKSDQVTCGNVCNCLKVRDLRWVSTSNGVAGKTEEGG